MSVDLDHATLAAVLEKLGLGVNASDLHGSLSGLLCAGAQVDPDNWLDALQLDTTDHSVAQNQALQHLYRSCRAQLDDGPVHIDPLLPLKSAPLAARAVALVEWCRGFLGGFGLGGASQLGPLSAEADAIVHDLGLVASSHFDVAEQGDDAQTLTDVIEFVRTACAALQRQVHLRERAPSVH